MENGRIIVCAISDQTIPNYLFIKQIYEPGDEILFISSKQKEEKIQYLKNVLLQYNEIKITPIILTNGAEEKWSVMKGEILSQIDKNRHYIVNLTGGTKYMSFIIQNVFSEMNASFYYIPFPKNIILGYSSDEEIEITYRVSVEEYMNLYGNSINSKDLIESEDYSFFFKKKFDEFDPNERKIINNLRGYRNGYKSIKTISLSLLEEKDDEDKFLNIKGIADFLKKIKFPLKIEEKLNKHEIQYLTGGWFEEYAYNFIKAKICPDDIKIGVLIKTGPATNLNDLDVVFTKGNKLFTIECKTGVDGKFVDFAYKASSIKFTRLGLSGTSYLFVYVDVDDTKKDVAHKMGLECYGKDYFIDDNGTNRLIDNLNNKV